MISRINPPVGSIDPASFEDVGVSPIVIHAGVAHLQGVTPLTGRKGSWSLVGAGSLPAQLTHVLGVIDRLLASIGGSRSDLLSLNVYVTDIRAFSDSLPILASWTGTDRPAVTAVGVTSLAHPEQMIEISAMARAR